MKDAVEVIDRLLSHLGTILRYIAPGFAALFVACSVFPGTRSFLSSASPAIVVLGMLLGPTIYGVHSGALVRLFWYPITCLLHKKKLAVIFKTMSELDDQRWLRRASEEHEVLSIQREMDRWAAMLNFLYCLSYTMILIPATAKISQRCSASSNWLIILLGGFVVLAAAIVSDYQICGKEIRLSDQYPDGRRPNQ
ncbi:MAG: hypothetical protein K9K86_10940 [Pseudomonadales bacterium]|nr:hypothetical protein [Pseudomonadales bacterium]